MTRRQHYQEAERLLNSVLDDRRTYDAATVMLIIATAQVHATLSLADRD